MKALNIFLFSIFLVVILFLFAPRMVAAAPPGNVSDWEQTFSDDFNGTTLDRTKWNTRGQSGEITINNELQAFSDNNISFNNGILSLTAKREVTPINYGGDLMNYSSAAITSAEKFYQQYGYFEIRAKMPGVKNAGENINGFWPAFWMVAQTEKGANEVDILEWIGIQPKTIDMSNWWGPYSNYTGVMGNTISYTPTGIADDYFTNSFHTYGLEWDASNIVWYIDGVVRRTFTNSDPKAFHPMPMYVILNLSIGSAATGWTGEPDAQTHFPNSFDIDYVKAYRKINGVAAAPQISPIKRVFDGPAIISLTTSTLNGEIRYTIDGTNPTVSSQLYTNAFILNTNTTLKAITLASGLTQSDTTTAIFTIYTNTSLLPSGWVEMNIVNSASIPLSGKTTYSNGTYLTSGAGFGISRNSDTFHYVYRQLPANGEIAARVVVQDPFGPKAKAGLMIRQDLTPSSRNVAFVITPSIGSLYTYRSNDNNTYTIYPADNGLSDNYNTDTTPIYLRLVRQDSGVTAYYKKNSGDVWISAGTADFPTGSAYVGFAVTSRYFDMLNTAVFDNVSVTGAVPFPTNTPGGPTLTPMPTFGPSLTPMITPTSAPPTPTTSPACTADIDGNHSVGIGDLQMVLTNFGSTTNTQADINKDSKVNMLDAGYIIRYWGGSC